jgi:type I restriction-modification system DNA methylase subunit
MTKITDIVMRIQNELRKDGITGIDAMHHITMILLSKSLDETQCNLLNIPVEFTYINMMSLTDNERFTKFWNPEDFENCLYYYIRDEHDFGYEDISFQLSSVESLGYCYSQLSKIDTEELFNKIDLIGDIYEHFINREGKSMKDLGQYFTDRTLIKYLVNMIDPKMNDNGVIQNVWDPAAGTGGFLIEYIANLNRKYKNIDWSTNKHEVYGNDINKTTSSLLKNNLYYSLKQMCGTSIDMQDSLKMDSDITYDNILANPPFGVKGLKYKEMNLDIKNLDINGTKGEILFLQLCMTRLNENGKCAVVVPEGVLFNSTKMYKETRKYLLENLNLKKVIKVGVGEFFKNTGVKTSVLYFEKTGQTENVEFIQVNKVNDSIEEVPLMTVEIDKIAENDYSLNMNLYKEIVLDTCENIIKMKKVDELFQLIKSTTGGTKNIPGDYRFINQNKKQKDKTHNSYRVEGKNLFIFNLNSIGKCYYYDGKCEFSNLLTCLKPVDENINPKYYYYYFNHIRKIIFDNYCTSACRNKLDIEPFKKLKIHFPPLEIQNRIVEQLDNIYETEIESSKKVIDSLKKSIETIMKNTMYRDDLQEYKIKDVCKYVNGPGHKVGDGCDNGDYPLLRSSINNKLKWLNTYDHEGPNVIIGPGGNFNIHYYRKFSVSGGCGGGGKMLVLINNDMIDLYYLYHIIKTNNEDMNGMYRGAALKHIDKNEFENYKIRIPPTEVQREILKQIEPKEKLIADLELNIVNANKEAKGIMNILFN